jgi:hypothetical protein
MTVSMGGYHSFCEFLFLQRCCNAEKVSGSGGMSVDRLWHSDRCSAGSCGESDRGWAGPLFFASASLLEGGRATGAISEPAGASYGRIDCREHQAG